MGEMPTEIEMRVHQIAHKLTDNNDKIELNPCLSLPAVCCVSMCESNN